MTHNFTRRFTETLFLYYDYSQTSGFWEEIFGKYCFIFRELFDSKKMFFINKVEIFEGNVETQS